MAEYKYTHTLKNGTVKTKTFNIKYDTYYEWHKVYREVAGKYFKRNMYEMRARLSPLDAIKKRLEAIASGVPPEEQPREVAGFHLGGAL
jgi:hypothetical protein